MAIPDVYRKNFRTMLDAVRNGDAVLVECQDRATGKPCYVVAAVSTHPDHDTYLAPFARLFDDNPYELLNPPNPDGGFYEP